MKPFMSIEKKIVKEKYINLKLYIDNYLYYHKMILNSYDNQNEDNLIMN